MKEEHVFKGNESLYDLLKEDPDKVEILENSIRSKLSRGFIFNLPSVRIIEIPERKLLRQNIEERYGITDVDNYFLPIIVDSLSYRQIKGMPEPNILTVALDKNGTGGLKEAFAKYHKLADALEGHVKRINGYHVSYISVNMSLDMAIEHEAVHAYTFENNRHYRRFAPSFGPSAMFPFIDYKTLGWIEAIAWTATTEEIDIDRILKTYVDLPENKTGYLKAFGAIPILTAYNIYELIKKNNPGNIPYMMGNMMLEVIALKNVFINKEEIHQSWCDSFQLAHDLKEKYGVKKFLKLAGKKHQNELKEMLHEER